MRGLFLCFDSGIEGKLAIAMLLDVDLYI